LTNRPYRIALVFGVAVPLLYFGAQLAAAPFFPGFSVLRHSASMLGSDLSTRPEILNTGAKLTGLATLIAALGFARGLRASGVHRVVVWLTVAALISHGLASLWAGSFPLPDRRHNPGPLSIGMFALPVLLLIGSWRMKGARGLRTYLLANLVFFVLMIPVMAGKAGIDRALYGGLLQRIGALALFLPIGVSAWHLRRTLARQPGSGVP
jgi:hypothetical membrane protein